MKGTQDEKEQGYERQRDGQPPPRGVKIDVHRVGAERSAPKRRESRQQSHAGGRQPHVREWRKRRRQAHSAARSRDGYRHPRREQSYGDDSGKAKDECYWQGRLLVCAPVER